LLLVEEARDLRNQNPSLVCSNLIICLNFEYEILETVQVTQRCENLLVNTLMCKGLQQEWTQHDDELRAHDSEMGSPQASKSSPEFNEIYRELNQDILKHSQTKAHESCNKLMTSIGGNITTCNELVTKVIDGFLKQWKLQQKYGETCTTDLDVIQSWCGKLAKSLLNTRETIQLTILHQERHGESKLGLLAFMRSKKVEVQGLLFKLIQSSFVFEKLPPQVIRTSSNFNATLRFLIVDALNITSFQDVFVKIMSEAQAQTFIQTGELPEEKWGKIKNNKGNFQFNEAMHQMTAKFNNMKIENFNRDGIDRFTLIFKSAVTIGDLKMNVSVVSLPTFIIVNSSQEIKALGRVFWDNYFSDESRLFFNVPDQVPWHQLAGA
jgi:hypothetical protein